jgi:hypothetical protein
MKPHSYYKLEQPPVTNLNKVRQRLERDINAYLAAGGQVQQVPRGVTKHGALSEYDIRATADKNRRLKKDE